MNSAWKQLNIREQSLEHKKKKRDGRFANAQGKADQLLHSEVQDQTSILEKKPRTEKASEQIIDAGKLKTNSGIRQLSWRKMGFTVD